MRWSASAVLSAGPGKPSAVAIGGNVAECAGGPRAFKYGVTKQYVLGLEAVLAIGRVIRTGGKVVKKRRRYDLTQLLVGSEGTLAIVTKITLRLIPRPPGAATMRATFPESHVR
jgi:glycolate oxidase